MKSDKHDRRSFLKTISISTSTGLLANPFSTAIAQSSLGDFEKSSTGEYLFSDGLTYLNTGTLGPCRKETIEKSQQAWEELEALPIKFYGKWGAESLAERTRITASKFLGCDMSEMVMTMSTTNGMNAIAQGLRLKAGDRILTTDQEHGGGALCWTYFAKYYGVIIDTVSIPIGDIPEELILNKINDNIKKETRLISISHIFSPTGLRLPIIKISAIARSKGILCVVDGAQAAGAVKVNLKELGCHAYATSGHKWLMGPKGTGLLYLSGEVQDIIRPMQFEQSYNMYNDSNGVVNLASILGLGAAIEYLEYIGIEKIEQHNLFLRNKLQSKLSNLKKLMLASPTTKQLVSPLLAYQLPDNIDRNTFTRMLYDKHKISIRPTHEQWFNGFRFSLHIFNTEKEIDFVADVIHKELA